MRLNLRSQIVYVHDIVMTAISFGLALYLRLGDRINEVPTNLIVTGGLTLTAIGAVVYLQTGLYRGIWRYASIRDFAAVAKAVSLTVLVFLLVMFLWTRLEMLPRSLPLINWLVLMALLGGPRLLYRVSKDRRLDLHDAPGGRRRVPVLLAGAGDGAELFLRALSQATSAEYRVVGILSEKRQRVGQQIHGISILNTVDDFRRAVDDISSRDEKPQRLILTKDEFDGSVVRRLLDECLEQGMTLDRIPKLTEFKSGNPESVEIRPVDVEDLLGRPQTTLDQKPAKALVANKRVLVTGAGGSIGSELVRQIVALYPAEIALLDNSEYALYMIDREVFESRPKQTRRAIIADVRNAARIETVFDEFRPDLVLHAAALKHVPLVEENCIEGISTNVLGTVNVAEACIRHDVNIMVQISTDKAINPTNFMGASKRIAEQYCQALDLARGDRNGTNFVTVRFGNVLGSTGSVVPLFQKQLQNGGPLTVTHPDMTRYFMTVREAVELVLLAAGTAQPGKAQDGKIFVLDMGEPVRITDLACQMIRLAGYEPDKDIKIEITGLRPGEKLFEEILHDSEEPVATEAGGILLAAPRVVDLNTLREAITRLEQSCTAGESETVQKTVSELVPEAALNGRSNEENELASHAVN